MLEQNLRVFSIQLFLAKKKIDEDILAIFQDFYFSLF